MRTWLPALAALTIATTAAAQPPLVPVGDGGCPATWAHRESHPGGFSCRDVRSGAFCSASTITTADAVAAERASITAMGFVVLRESDDGARHAFVYDDAAGHRMIHFVRTHGAHTSVRCGASRADFDGLVPLFTQVAQTAD